MPTITLTNSHCLTFIGVFSALLLSCELNESKRERYFDIQVPEDITAFDSLSVTLFNTGMDSLEQPFLGKANSANALSHLRVFQYHGQDVWIKIIGFSNDSVVYDRRIAYSGATQATLDKRLIRVPGTRISLEPVFLDVEVNSQTKLPEASLIPDSLYENETAWVSRDSSIAMLQEGDIVFGVAPGTTHLVSFWTLDERIRDSLQIHVKPPKSKIGAQIDSTSNSDSSRILQFLDKEISLFVGDTTAIPPIRKASQIPDSNLLIFSLAPNIAFVKSMEIVAVQPGTTYVAIETRIGPRLADSLLVIVRNRETSNHGVWISKDTLTAYVRSRPYQAPVTLTNLDWADMSWEIEFPSIAKHVVPDSLVSLSPGKTSIMIYNQQRSLEKGFVFEVLNGNEVLGTGRDTLVSMGQELNISLRPHSAFGTLEMVYWSFDDDSSWDDSSSAVKPLSISFSEPGTRTLYFGARNSAMDTVFCSKRIVVLEGLAVTISSPKDSTYTNQSPISIDWSINGETQNFESEHHLRPGRNLIIRTASDSMRQLFSDSIVVFYDTISPSCPAIDADTLTNSARPKWTWRSGGGDSNLFRFATVRSELQAAIAKKDTSFAPSMDLSDGYHTVFVQEKDEAGNWSGICSLAIRVDRTPPIPPVFFSVTSPTNEKRPEWRWVSQETPNAGLFRWSLNPEILSQQPFVKAASFKPAANLLEGVQYLYIQERDAAGNESAIVSAAIETDYTPPQAPVLSIRIPEYGSEKPRHWHWRSGSGGNGEYRYWLSRNGFAHDTTTTKDTTLLPTNEMFGKRNELYLQERDPAGNWSSAARAVLEIPEWKLVGESKFGPVSTSFSLWPHLYFNLENTPYLAFAESANGTDSRAKVMKYDGQKWVEYGPNLDFSAYSHSFHSDSAGTLYLSYSDNLTSNVRLFKFNQNAWVEVGAEPSRFGAEHSFCIDSDGFPVLFYLAREPSLIKWNGTSWDSVSTAGISVPGSQQFRAFWRFELACHPNKPGRFVLLESWRDRTEQPDDHIRIHTMVANASWKTITTLSTVASDNPVHINTPAISENAVFFATKFGGSYMAIVQELDSQTDPLSFNIEVKNTSITPTVCDRRNRGFFAFINPSKVEQPILAFLLGESGSFYETGHLSHPFVPTWQVGAIDKTDAPWLSIRYGDGTFSVFRSLE